MLSEELILHYIPKVFKGYQVKEKSLLRVTRNADIDADALYDEDLDYREFMADLIKKRKKLAPVRIELSRKLSEGSVKLICEHLAIKSQYVFHSQAPLDLSFVFQIEDALRKIPELFYERRTPRKSPAFTGDRPILDQIKEKDKLLSYPYESINPFLNMLHEAANDKDVVSIKMTLYRVAKQSKVVEALIEAAEAIEADGHTADSYEALQAAIAAAKGTAADDNATTSDVTRAITNLSTAIANLEKITLDTSALEHEIELAEQILANIDDYVASTVEGLQEKVDAAKAALTNATSQAEIDEATKTLREARLSARTKADTSALED